MGFVGAIRDFVWWKGANDCSEEEEAMASILGQMTRERSAFFVSFEK